MKDSTTTYLVQIVNKPSHVIALKGWQALSILLPVKYVIELAIEIG